MSIDYSTGSGALVSKPAEGGSFVNTSIGELSTTLSAANLAKVAQTAAELAETNASLSEANAASSESNAAASESVVLDNASNTASDRVATNADVLLTHADVVLAEADKVQTGLDRVATGSHRSSTTLDAASTAADRLAIAEIYDNFDDRFLGLKASDPTLDNDGEALTAGSVYYNSVVKTTMFYNGATWESPEETATTGALTATNKATEASTSADTAIAQANIALTESASATASKLASAASASTASAQATNSSTSATAAALSASTALSDAAAAAGSATSAGNSATSAGSSATAAADSLASFTDQYTSSVTEPASPDIGDLWFDEVADKLKAYSSSGWENSNTLVNGVSGSIEYISTAGQSSYAVEYDVGYINVYMNGILLADSDFSGTDGSNVVLTVAAAEFDIVYIQTFGTFELADHYNKVDSDTLLSNKVNNSKVLTDVPAGAVFTDTVYAHPANHDISVITGLQSALDSKVDDSQVLTDVPAGALFTDTDTIYTPPESYPISIVTGLQDSLDSKTTEPYVNGAMSSTLTSANLYTDTAIANSVIDGGTF